LAAVQRWAEPDRNDRAGHGPDAGLFGLFGHGRRSASDPLCIASGGAVLDLATLNASRRSTFSSMGNWKLADVDSMATKWPM